MTAICTFAQNTQSVRDRYMQRMQAARDNYNSLRDKCNVEYAEKVRQEWNKFSLQPADTIIKQKEIVPAVFTPEDIPTGSFAIAAGEVISASQYVSPRPEPVEKYEELKGSMDKYFNFKFLGTGFKVRVPYKKPELKSTYEDAVSDIWKFFSKKEDYNNLVYDFLQIRDKHNLCDWAYLKIIEHFTKEYYRGMENEAAVLTGFIYAQSGYKVRFARAVTGKLYMLFNSQYSLSLFSYFIIDGIRYYVSNDENGSESITNIIGEKAHVSQVAMQNEQPVSMAINKSIILDIDTTGTKFLTSARYPDLSSNVNINRNIIDFYNSYPTAYYFNDFRYNWANKANTPISDEVKAQLYPNIEKAIAGKDTVESLNTIINFVQTAFLYQKDDDAWGTERIFFPEETLYYPSSDCEDRAILFSRLVRDILGLDVILLHYPNHLACAVSMNLEDIEGSYIPYNDKYYILCDPTYKNASIGCVIPECRGMSAAIIDLNK